jgi:hypothetical protein
MPRESTKNARASLRTCSRRSTRAPSTKATCAWHISRGRRPMDHTSPQSRVAHRSCLSRRNLQIRDGFAGGDLPESRMALRLPGTLRRAERVLTARQLGLTASQVSGSPEDAADCSNPLTFCSVGRPVDLRARGSTIVRSQRQKVGARHKQHSCRRTRSLPGDLTLRANHCARPSSA